MINTNIKYIPKRDISIVCDNYNGNAHGVEGDGHLYHLIDSGHEILLKKYIRREYILKDELCIAAHYPNINIIKTLLDYGADINNNGSYLTPIECAIHRGNNKTIEFMIKNGANVNKFTEYSALMRASKIGDMSIVKLLLRYNARIDLKSLNGETAISIAIKNEHHEIAGLLLEKLIQNCELNSRNSSILLSASAHDYVDVVDYLIKKGITIDEENVYGESAIIIASKLGNIDTIMRLANNGANINKRDIYGKTAIIHAVINNHIKVVEYLQNLGADINTIDKSRNSAFYYAINNKNIDMLLAINSAKQTGTNTYKILNQIRSILKLTNKKDLNNMLFIIAIKFQRIDVLEFILSHGADINAKDIHGKSAIMHAIETNNLELIEYFLEKFIGICNDKDIIYDIIDYIIEHEKIDILALLVSCDSDIDYTNILYAAMRFQSVKTLKFLITSGVKLDKDKAKTGLNGFLADSLELAVESNNKELTELLLIHEYLFRPFKIKQAILAAAAGNNIEMMQLFIDHKFKFDGYFDEFDYMKHTTSYSDIQIWNFLLQQRSSVYHDKKNLKLTNEALKLLINKYDYMLKYATSNNKIEIMKFILWHRASVYYDKKGLELTDVVQSGCFEVLKLLINDGYDVNIATNDGTTPLMIAAEQGNENIVKFLIDHGADIVYRNDCKDTALTLASKNKHIEIINILCHYKNVNHIDNNDDAYQSLLEAISSECIDVIEALLKYIPNTNRLQDFKDTPLIKAVETRNIEIVSKILTKCSDVNEEINDYRYGEDWTALQLAVYNNDMDIAILLLQNGAKFDIKEIFQDSHYYNFDNQQELETYLYLSKLKDCGKIDFAPVVIKKRIRYCSDVYKIREHINLGYIIDNRLILNAIDHGYIDIVSEVLNSGIDYIINYDLFFKLISFNLLDAVEFLIKKGLDININYNGITPLLKSLNNKNSEMAELLINQGADVKCEDEQGNTPLHIAAAHDFLYVVNLILKQNTNVDCVNKENETPLLLALENCNTSIAVNLINKGADISYSKCKGITPLFIFAKKALSHEGVWVHFQNAFKSRKIYIDDVDSYGNTPLLNILEDNLYYSRLDKEKVLKALSLFLCSGANIHARNNKGNTPILLATLNCNKEIVEYLIDMGANIEDRDNNMKTPLIISANDYGLCSSYMTKLLLQKGANPDCQDNEGKTALMYAISKSNYEVIYYLIDHGTNINIKDNSGCTALMYAVRERLNIIVELLLEHGANTYITNNNGESAFDLALNTKNYNIADTIFSYPHNK